MFPWEAPLALDFAVTLTATLGLCVLGASLQRTVARGKRGFRSFRLPRRLLRSFRVRQLHQFKILATQVAADAESALDESAPWEARALLPLVADARGRGETLLGARRSRHKILHPGAESELSGAVDRLTRVEGRLRALPKSRLSLADVLAGDFDLEEHGTKTDI